MKSWTGWRRWQTWIPKKQTQSRVLVYALVGSVAGALTLATLLTALEYRADLRKRGLANLNQVLTLQKHSYTTYIEDLREATMVAGHNGTVERELPQLIRAFGGLRPTGDINLLKSSIQRQLIMPLQQHGHMNHAGLDASGLLPGSPQGIALQEAYIAGAVIPRAELLAWDGPGVNAYDRLYASVHEELYPMLHSAGFHDIFLVSLSGDVVFSIAKEFDLGTNLLTGPYADSGLGQVVQALRRKAPTKLASEQKELEDMVEVSTVKPYVPSQGAASIFSGSPVYLNGELQGYLCAQADFQAFIKALSSNYQWQAMGLGSTGDLLLLDREGTRVSMPRLTHTDRQKGLDQLTRNGNIPAEQLSMLRKAHHLSGLLVEKGTAVDSVLAGGSGSGVRRNLFGEQVLAAWSPVQDPSNPDAKQSWGLLAEQSESEVYAPLRQLLIHSIGSSMLVLLATAAFAMWLSRRLTGPLIRVQALTRELIVNDVQSDEARLIPNKLRSVAAGTSTEVGILASDLAALQDDLFNSFDSLQKTSATVESLSTPISRIGEGVLLLPLVGHLDNSRAQRVKNAALTEIVERHAHFFIWDLAGLAGVEGGIAPFLGSLCQAAQLLGCRSILSGVTPRLAAELSSDKISLGQAFSTASLQDALALTQKNQPGAIG